MLSGGNEYNVEEELVVRTRDDYDHDLRLNAVQPEYGEISGPFYLVDPQNWEEYDGWFQYNDNSDVVRSSPALEAGEVHLDKSRKTGTGVINPRAQHPTRWSPGIHTPSNHVPLAFDARYPDSVSHVEIWGARRPDDTDRFRFDKRETFYEGELKGHWYEPYAEDDRLQLGAVDIGQFIAGQDVDAYGFKLDGGYLHLVGPTADIGYELMQIGRWPDVSETSG